MPTGVYLRKRFSEKHRKNMGKVKKGKSRPDMAKRWMGEKNPNWKGGISKENRYRHYYDAKYKKWRMAVFTRDNFTCQFCGIRGVYLTVHHIKSWAHYPELRLNINNGITLCEECHKLTDNYKGRKK
tara:strand:+ start:120 stop:500 length:381 start_codon:yes stop_codon:yes gene_type:complete